MHYLNNGWVDKDNLVISAFDLSITRGFGVFDFLRTYHSKPFFLKDHIKRFNNSLKILGMKSVKTDQEITNIVLQGIKKNGFKETNIKIVQTGGFSDDGITPNGTHSFVAMFTPATIYPKEYYQKGVKIITWPMGRIYTAAKSLNYMAGVLALIQAKKQGALEALYVDQKHIYECVTSNFYAVIKGKIVTDRKNILMGITRKVVLSLAKKLGIKVVERTLLIKEILSFDEAFLSASNKEVMPVVQIDKTIIGNGKPGPITKKIMQAFRIFTDNYK
jgi:branched-chain amino acid aminotransferase